MGEKEVEDVLQRLDRLTDDEARMTGTETLQVVHGLVTNMKLIIDGTQLPLFSLWMAHGTVIRIDGRTSMDNIRQALGMFLLREMVAILTVDTSYDATDDK